MIVRCARAGCGRRLTSPKSIAAGVGPVCARKLAEKAPEVIDRFKPAVVHRALTLIGEGKVRPVRGTRSFTVAGASGTYTASAVSCTCPAGRHQRDCYHLVAAKLLTA